jgi:hypothetical protein
MFMHAEVNANKGQAADSQPPNMHRNGCMEESEVQICSNPQKAMSVAVALHTQWNLLQAPTTRLEISVVERQFEPFRATKMQRPCSAALIANRATARQTIGCVRNGIGFDPRSGPCAVR